MRSSPKLLEVIGLATLLVLALTGCPSLVANLVGTSESVQKALDQATPGTKIVVYGTHQEDLKIDKDGITISGREGTDPTIDGDVVVTGDNVTIENITITGRLETLPGSFKNLTLNNVTIWGTVINGTFSCEAVVNPGESIQDAVNASNPGGSVCVGYATYNEAIRIDKQLSLVGMGQPVIRPDNTTPLYDNGVRRVAIYVDSVDNVTVEGFEIDGTGGDVHIGIYFFNSNNSIVRNNVVHDMKNDPNPPISDVAGLGILFFGWGQGIDGALVEDNTVYNTGRMGIFVGGSAVSRGNIIRDNIIYNAWQGPTNDWGGAVQINIPKDSQIIGNIIHDSGLNMPGVYIFSSSGSNAIEYNNVYNNKYGIAIWGSNANKAPEVHYNNIYDNFSYGLINFDANPDQLVNAENNWWGAPTGPTHPSNPGGTGDAVSDNVDFTPWATSPF